MITPVFNKIIAAFLTLFVFTPVRMPAAYTVDKSARMTAVVVSDTHMEGNNTGRFGKLSRTFTGIASSAEKPDALIFCGDNTMNGQRIEWLFFYGFLQRTGLLRSTNVIVSMGNHDFGNCADAQTYDTLSKRAIREYNAFTGRNIERVWYSTDVNGIRVITLASDKNMEDTVSFIGEEQIEFLKSELKAAGGSPVIVVNHNPLKNTNRPQSEYRFNNTVNHEKIRAALEEYDGTVLFFSGHTHYGVNGNTVVTQKNVTYINMPLLDEGAYDPANEECDDAGTGCRVSVYSDRAELSFINFQTGKPIRDYEKITVTYQTAAEPQEGENNG